MARPARPPADGAKAFTLIELLIVITILGILAAIVVFAIGGITDRGNKSACKSDRATVEVASEAYFAAHHSYAPDIQTLVNSSLVRELPSTTNGYTISYNSTDGSVTADGC